MAGETWGSMRQDLKTLRVRIFKKQSLRNLCLAKIADTLQLHFSENRFSLRKRLRSSATEEAHQDPFKDLPAVLMASLQQTLLKRLMYINPRVLFCLVGENTDRLNIDLSCGSRNSYIWSKEEAASLLMHIRDKGHNISSLSISLDWGVSVTFDLLQSMLGSLTKLTSLNLKLRNLELNSGDSILAVIGSSCPGLRNLTFTDNVTDEGLPFLYDSNLPHGPNGEEYGKCKMLTHLDVECCKTGTMINNEYVEASKVTIDGLVALLSNLPELVYLKHKNIYLAIAKFAENNEKQLKLQHLQLPQHTVERELLVGDTLASVISKVPDTRKLDITSQELKNVDEFLKLEHINDLSIIVRNPGSTQVVMSLITNLSQQLTKLHLVIYGTEVDISIIGFHCRQLTEFIWCARCTTESAYKLLPSIHFNKLRKVVLNSVERVVPFVNDAIKCILASPCLESYESLNYIVPDSTLSWLIEEARAHGVVFSNLYEFTLNHFISSLRAKQILCVAPKLKIFKIPHRATNENVQQFMTQHGLKHCQIKNNIFW